MTPLREGGSLPAVVEADDDWLYVAKFRGAGHGEKALVTELIAGEIGRALGLLVPEIVFFDFNPRLAAAEPPPTSHNIHIRQRNGPLGGTIGRFDPVSHREVGRARAHQRPRGSRGFVRGSSERVSTAECQSGEHSASSGSHRAEPG